jgi:hypothetical protein
MGVHLHADALRLLPNVEAVVTAVPPLDVVVGLALRRNPVLVRYLTERTEAGS